MRRRREPGAELQPQPLPGGARGSRSLPARPGRAGEWGPVRAGVRTPPAPPFSPSGGGRGAGAARTRLGSGRRGRSRARRRGRSARPRGAARGPSRAVSWQLSWPEASEVSENPARGEAALKADNVRGLRGSRLRTPLLQRMHEGLNRPEISGQALRLFFFFFCIICYEPLTLFLFFLVSIVCISDPFKGGGKEKELI